MKKLTIRARVTIWYTLLLCVLLFCIIWSIQVTSRAVIKGELYEDIAFFVEKNAEEVEWDDGEIEIDDDFKIRENGMVCLVYGKEGELLAGKLPSDMIVDYPFADGQEINFPARGREYYLFDKEVRLEEGHSVWLRGLIYDRETERVLEASVESVFLVLPLFLAAAAFGGYFIIKQAFKPIETMICTVEEINAGSDLSKRIPVEGGKDEVYRLAINFNEMIKRLETEFEVEKQFTSNVSHELRTPVTVILTQCEIALEDSELSEEEREAFEVIRRQAHRMTQMIAQFLMLTRLEQGVEEIRKEKTDLKELVEQVCAEKQRLETGKPILCMELFQDIETYVNREMVSRLLFNLLDNACKYGKDGGRVFVSLKEQEGEIRLSVRDEGEGIPEEAREKIWNRFYQAKHRPDAGLAGGIGLGLFMVKEIARLHGGRVELESESGKGSTFTFCLKRE